MKVNTLLKILLALAIVLRIAFFVVMIGSVIELLYFHYAKTAFWMAFECALYAGIVDPGLGNAIKQISEGIKKEKCESSESTNPKC